MRHYYSHFPLEFSFLVGSLDYCKFFERRFPHFSPAFLNRFQQTRNVRDFGLQSHSQLSKCFPRHSTHQMIKHRPTEDHRSKSELASLAEEKYLVEPAEKKIFEMNILKGKIKEIAKTQFQSFNGNLQKPNKISAKKNKFLLKVSNSSNVRQKRVKWMTWESIFKIRAAIRS